MTIEERVPAWREWAGLSKTDVASALEVSVQTVRNWEDGTYAPTHDHLERFAALIGISLSQFWGPLPPERRGAA